MKTSPTASRCGFTLIEMLVVITIIMIIAGLVVGSMGFVQDKQARETAKAQIALLSKAIEEYKMDMGVYPGTNPNTPADGLVSEELYNALFHEGWNFVENNAGTAATAKKIYLAQLDPRENKQGWVDKVAASATPAANQKIRDPWGNEYRYRRGSNAQNPDFDLWSSGKDGVTKTGATASDLNHKDCKDDIRNF